PLRPPPLPPERADRVECGRARPRRRRLERQVASRRRGRRARRAPDPALQHDDPGAARAPEGSAGPARHRARGRSEPRRLRHRDGARAGRRRRYRGAALRGSRDRAPAASVGALALLSAGAAVAAEPSPTWLDRFTFTVSDRIRGEFVDWFAPPAGAAPDGANRYNYIANRFRAGVRVLLPPVELNLQLQDTELANLPTDASLPPPIGNLGP